MDFLKKLFGDSSMSAASPLEIKDRLEGKDALFVLDVRQPQEFAGGHIKGAKLIPLNELNKRMGELPQDKEILVVCHSGSRSSMAARQLAGAGFKVVNLRGGMMAWSRAGLSVKNGK